ncbi:MAG: hypothetical protein IKL38_04570 [Firmicutes bacterium]|nr:hypothetical protein [Bacillota bacterium]MBR6683595.1 hypothetical protein [Bacillota bacterium]
MGMNGMGGPDMAKMLQMMMPYMDPSTKRMMNIMMKLQELRSLMEPLHSDKSESDQPESNQSMQPKSTQATKLQKEETKADLAAALQEGLTPEQQSMITSLSGMLR